MLYLVICDHYDSLAVERPCLWLSGGHQGASPVEQGLVLAHSCPSGKAVQDFERMLLLNPSFHLSYKLSCMWSLTAEELFPQ